MVLAGAVVVVQDVAKLSTMKLRRSKLEEPGADPCPTPEPSLPDKIQFQNIKIHIQFNLIKRINSVALLCFATFNMSFCNLYAYVVFFVKTQKLFRYSLKELAHIYKRSSYYSGYFKFT